MRFHMINNKTFSKYPFIVCILITLSCNSKSVFVVNKYNLVENERISVPGISEKYGYRFVGHFPLSDNSCFGKNLYFFYCQEKNSYLFIISENHHEKDISSITKETIDTIVIDSNRVIIRTPPYNYHISHIISTENSHILTCSSSLSHEFDQLTHISGNIYDVLFFKTTKDPVPYQYYANVKKAYVIKDCNLDIVTIDELKNNFQDEFK